MLLAHREIDREGKVLEQTLEAHINETGKRAGEIGAIIGLGLFMKLAGYIHDSGKADRCFQNLICGRIKHQVNHSSAGGRILDDYIHSDPELTNLQQTKGKFAYFQEILTYIILAHHGLYDIIPYGSTENKTYQRLHYDEEGEYHYIEDVVPFAQRFNLELQERGEASITTLIKEAYREFELIYSELVRISGKNCDKEKMKEEKEYYISCLTRLCLSILKEADIYDSANAFHHPKQHLWNEEERVKVWAEASNRVELMYHNFENDPILSEINKTRNNLANLAKNAAINNKNGIYKLELPTGAGKTKAGLRYALTNAKEYNRNRVFYITAYLSVLEQNAEDIRSVIDMEDVILEHHSNIVEDIVDVSENKDDYGDYEHQAYLKESWDSPVILTTMVQFFNTLFKEKASNIRRFCKLINSVIIIDEVQSLPLKVLSNFNLMMNFLKEIMHCNIVHCTATQPVLDSEAMSYQVRYGNEKDEQDAIVNMDMNMMECFHRVDFYNLTGKDAGTVLSTENLTTLIQDELLDFDSCLVVLNTKAAVAKLCDYLEKTVSDIEIIYLTTNLCAAHRLDLILELKKKLKLNRIENAHHKIICVSTQLIEAGVDVDFDVVFRSMAGIDSLVQCAGRCNREGKLNINGVKINGRLFIMHYIEESLSNLPDIKASVSASEYAIRSLNGEQCECDKKIMIDKLQRPYFEKYYVSNRSKLDYVDLIRESSMVIELGKNAPDRNSYTMANHKERKPMMYQAFRTAAENFQMIDQGTTGVLVAYQNQELLERLEIAMNNKDYKGIKVLLQRLQRYSINIYLSPKLEPFISKNNEVNVFILLKEYYNGTRGIITKELVDWIL